MAVWRYLISYAHKSTVVDPDMVTDPNGAYKEDFQHIVDKTAFLGVAMPEGSVWRIKGAYNRSCPLVYD